MGLYMQKFIDFLNRLEKSHIFYKLDKTNDEYIMVEIAVPGQRWEVEFSENDIRIEKFISDGCLCDKSEIEALFRDFSD